MKLTPKSKEWLIIIVAWGLIFASSPLYMYYALVSINQELNWMELLEIWSYLSVFLVLFLLHHFVIAPQLIEKKRMKTYIVCLVASIGLFVGFLVSHKDDFRPMDDRSPMPMARPVKGAFLPPPDMACLVIALLMIGVDLGVVSWLQQQKMQKRLLMLEQQNLKQELDHLRYQINPHFFMNTLNNIHSLVDIDQEQAQRAIVELSKLMRYALYEGSGSLAPLQHELEFMEHYLSLMRLRFGEKVQIRYEVPETVSAEVMVPPLIFVSFMENAFKHGVSYKEESYVDIRLTLDAEARKLCFCCDNSRHAQTPSTDDGHHGIGLENVRKRLELQFPDDQYSLRIDERDPTRYVTILQLTI